MTEKIQKALLIVIGLITVAVSLAHSGQPDYVIFTCFGAITTILGLCWSSFNKLLWRFPFMYHLHEIPNIRGNWKGECTEFIKNQANVDKSQSESLNIDQKFSSILINIPWSDQSQSKIEESVPYAVSGKDTKFFSFVANYSFTPKAGNPFLRKASVVILVKGDKPSKPKEISIIYSTVDGERTGLI